MNEINYTTIYDEFDDEIEILCESSVEEAIKEAEQDINAPEYFVEELKKYANKGLWCGVEVGYGCLVFFEPVTRCKVC